MLKTQMSGGPSRRAFLRNAALVGGGAAMAPGLGALLEACGGSSGGTRQLEFLAWEQFPGEAKTYGKLAQSFEKKNNAKVNFTLYPGFNNFETKLQADFAAGNPPDILAVSVAYAWDYANSKQTVDLSKYVSKLDQSKYFLNAGGPVRFPNAEGKWFAMPFEWVSSVLYYNKDMFDKAHVPYPTDSWTYDDVLSAAKELTGPGQWGIESYSAHTFLDALISSNGGAVIDKAYKKCVLNQPESIESIQWAVDLIHTYKVAPTPDESTNAGLVAAGPFQTGKIAMQIDGGWGIASLKSVKFNWDIALVPKGKVKRVIYGGPDSFGIAAKSSDPDLSWELINILVGPGRPPATYADGTVPILRESAASPEWSDLGRPYSKDVLLRSSEWVEGAEFGHNWDSWRLQIMNQDLAPAFINGSSVPQAVAKTVQDVNAALAKPF